jgi:hypothetical protein
MGVLKEIAFNLVDKSFQRYGGSEQSRRSHFKLENGMPMVLLLPAASERLR